MVQNKSTRPRGRPRGYDPEEALSRATDAFWITGFAGTSLDDLSAATAMNRPSLYGAFGDKHTLYLATLERYIAEGRKTMMEELSADRPLAEGVQGVYARALDGYLAHTDDARGCFLLSTAVTEARHDPEVKERLAEGLAAFDAIFETRLERARDTGELPPTSDPVLLAKLASAILHSLAVRSRAGDTRAALEATALAGVQLICGETRR